MLKMLNEETKLTFWLLLFNFQQDNLVHTASECWALQLIFKTLAKERPTKLKIPLGKVQYYHS